jgi:hypothetical protein
LDHFFSNSSKFFLSTEIITATISDHFIPVCHLIPKKNLPKTKIISRRNFSKTNNENFSNALRSITSMPSKIISEIPATNLPFDLHHAQNPNSPTLDFENNPVTATEITNAVNELLSKNSEDMFGISMYF